MVALGRELEVEGWGKEFRDAAFGRGTEEGAKARGPGAAIVENAE